MSGKKNYCFQRTDCFQTTQNQRKFHNLDSSAPFFCPISSWMEHFALHLFFLWTMARFHCSRFLDSGADMFHLHLSLLDQLNLLISLKVRGKSARKFQRVFHRSNSRLHCQESTGITEHSPSDWTVKSERQEVKQVHKSHHFGCTYQPDQSQCGSFTGRTSCKERIAPITGVSRLRFALIKEVFSTQVTLTLLEFPRMITFIATRTWALR